MGAKDEDRQSQNGAEDDNNLGKDKNKPEKEINDMQEPEVDDNQIDPYHGNEPEYPEPEEMELPDDLELDDGNGEDKEDDGGNDENPFDIDSMKGNHSRFLSFF